MWYHKIPKSARCVMEELNQHGHQAYLVGGCVRDLLMGREPHDWDICTSARPKQIKECFSKYRLIETGLKHGTLTVVAEGQSYEVTTFRIDGVYRDGRHPEKVSFTSELKEDLARRDFTMNAIAMNRAGEFFDPYGGCEDIKARIIRCVGDPVKRFDEDGLRLLRAIRFSSVLDFELSPNTVDAIHNCREKLRNISVERIMMELTKLMAGEKPGEKLKDFHDILTVFWPEIIPCVGFEQRNPYHLFDIWTHTLVSVDRTDTNDFIVRLALLLHDIGKPSCFTIDEMGKGHFHGHPAVSAAMADKMLRRLKFDTVTREEVVQLITYHDTVIIPEMKYVRRWLNRLGVQQLNRLLSVMLGDALAHNPALLGDRVERIEKIRRLVKEIQESQMCCSVKELKLNGRDVLAAGIPQGPEVGQILTKVLNRVLDGELDNKREILLEEIHRISENRAENGAAGSEETGIE